MRGETLVVRFWSKVEKGGPDDCWIWRGARTRAVATPQYSAYGQILFKGKMVGAHRVSYEMANGPIPTGLFVLHNCDNHFCVNPAHLRVGTAKENMQDCMERGRHKIGSQVTNAVLIESEVAKIRALRILGWKRPVLAKKFGCALGTIKSILQGDTWKHVRPDGGILKGGRE